MIKKVRSRRTRRIAGKGPTAETWEDEVVEVELHDAQAALAILAKHYKLFDEIAPKVSSA